MNKNSDNIINIHKQSDPNKFSRYRNLNVFIDDVGDEYLETYSGYEIPITSGDKYHQIETGEEGRLDLIAYKYYGHPMLYWIIAEANEIIDPLSITVGDILRIPSTQSLYGYKGVLL